MDNVRLVEEPGPIARATDLLEVRRPVVSPCGTGEVIELGCLGRRHVQGRSVGRVYPVAETGVPVRCALVCSSDQDLEDSAL
eukprot:3938100-Rhodomonas_salina.2